MAKDQDDKPRGRVSSYAYFVQKSREEFVKKNPNTKPVFAEFSKKCSEQWKKMGDNEKKKYILMADKDKKRFQDEMKDYVPPKGETGRRKKAKKDPNAPKRALSAFFLFCNDERAKVKATLPAGSTVGDVAKELGKKWKQINAKDKSKYEQLALKEKSRYEKELSAYKSKQNAGGAPGRKSTKSKRQVESSDDESEEEEQEESSEEEEDEEDDE